MCCVWKPTVPESFLTCEVDHPWPHVYSGSGTALHATRLALGPRHPLSTCRTPSIITSRNRHGGGFKSNQQVLEAFSCSSPPLLHQKEERSKIEIDMSFSQKYITHLETIAIKKLTGRPQVFSAMCLRMVPDTTVDTEWAVTEKLNRGLPEEQM